MGLSEVLCAEHADEAAFLWTYRDRAATDWAYDVAGLAELDERVEAHVDGLRIAGHAGLSKALELLDEGEPGSAFVAMLLAVERSDLRMMAQVLDVAGEGESAREVVAAMAWAPWENVRGVLPGLLSARCPPALHWIGLGACAAHRMDPATALTYALYAEDERLVCRALRTAGQLGRKDLLIAVEDWLERGAESCRAWAAWSAALLGSKRAAALLWGLAEKNGTHGERASVMAARITPIAESLSRIYALAKDGRSRIALAGAAALGDPTLVPWLFDCMSQAEMTRAAGLAFTMITGLDLEAEKFVTEAPDDVAVGPNDDPDDENVAMDPDASLPWPDVPVLQGWWSREKSRFDRGTRYVLGKPLSREALEAIWNEGRQPARDAAAIEMVLGGQTRALAESRRKENGI